MNEALVAADRRETEAEVPPAAAPCHGAAADHSSVAGCAELDRLWARGRAFLGTNLAIMGGAMTWVSERHLVAAISRLEAAGGVERWSAAVQADAELAASRARADTEQRAIRRDLAAGETGRDGGASLDLGVGGAGRTGSIKCLHAHAAFALARPGYELGERILDEIDPLWPATCCMIQTH